VFRVFVGPAAFVPQIRVGQFVRDDPSCKWDRFSLDGSLEHDRPSGFPRTGETHGYVKYDLRAGVEVTNDKMRIIEKVGADCFGKIPDDGREVIPDPPVQRKCAQPLIDRVGCHVIFNSGAGACMFRMLT